MEEPKKEGTHCLAVPGAIPVRGDPICQYPVAGSLSSSAEGAVRGVQGKWGFQS